MKSASRLLLPFLVVLGGCATPLAWEPRVERLPEMPAAPVRQAAAAPAPVASAAPATSASVAAGEFKPVPVTFDEMVKMAKEGTPSGVIIQKLRDSRLTYSVNDEEARSLASRGVPQEVIAYLQHGEAGLAPRQAAPSTYEARPVYPAPYYAYPYAYPYPYYGYYGPRYYGPGFYAPYPRAGISFGFRIGGRRR
jgi:hypothetical protein